MITSTRTALIAGLACAAMGGATLAQSAETRTYPCHRLASAPAMDGKLDEPVWKTLPEAAGFYTLGCTPGQHEYAEEKETLFCAGWTDDSLYVAVRCVEPDMSAMKPGDNIWTSESLELFFAPESGSTRYYQLAVSSAGVRWNGMHDGTKLHREELWKWAAVPGTWDRGWQLEIRIPFEVLGTRPSDGDQWGVNVGRNLLTGPESERHSCWAPVTGAFGAVTEFAALAFEAGTLTPAAAEAASCTLNADFLARLPKGFEVIAESGFEKPSEWAPNTSMNPRTPGGAMQTVDGGRSGNCLRVTNIPTSQFRFRTSNRTLVNPTEDRIRVSVYVKGKGRFRAGLYCYAPRSFAYVASLFKGTVSIDSDEWERFEFACDFSGLPQPKRDAIGDAIGSVMFAFEVFESSDLSVDDFRAIRPALPTMLPLSLAIDRRDADDVAVIINGRPITETDGAWPIELDEGLNIIGITATAAGKRPGLRVSVPGRPMLAHRWRGSTATDNIWLTPSFDDRTWQVVAPDDDGFFWGAPEAEGKVCFRQIVLWGKHYYSGLPCIQPKVREFGFSQNSHETLFHTLYAPPPLSFPLEDYEFVLDVPKGFSLIKQDYGNPKGGGWFNRAPQEATTDRTEHTGEAYTRYRLAFASEDVKPFSNEGIDKDKPYAARNYFRRNLSMTLIPLFQDDSRAAGETCAFRFRRLASGNITEVEQDIPVRVLPPINGRMLKNVRIQQYMSLNVWAGSHHTKLYPEHLDALMQDALATGFNSWIFSGATDLYDGAVARRAVAGGARIGIWGAINYPLHGNTLGPDSALEAWLSATPQARARYFNDKPRSGRALCRSFITGPGRAGIKAAIKADIARMAHGGGKFAGLPGTTFYWTDLEYTPWGGPANQEKDPNKAKCVCFCDKCKQAFRKHANLPADADLPDNSIHKNYYREWDLFCRELTGRLNGIVKEACNELGFKYLFYDMVVLRDNWPPMAGNIDMACPGLPGGDYLYGSRQAQVDAFADWLRELGVGIPQMLGQQFAANFFLKPAVPWGVWSSRQEEFFIPRNLKQQVLRMVAATRGGIELGCCLERVAGQRYWIGEATRLIGEYEDVFWNGERDDDLAESEQLDYPNLLVVRKGDERIVLLFNESEKQLTVTFRNKDLRPNQSARIFYGVGSDATPEEMTVTVPAQDVEAVCIR